MATVFKFFPGSAKTAPVIRAFASKKDANSTGNSGAIFTNADELKNAMVIATGDMVVIHNMLAPDKPVTKFQDREAAARRVFALVEKLTPEASNSSNGDDMDKNVSNKAAADADKTKAAQIAKDAKAKAAQDKKDLAVKTKADKAAKAKEAKDAKAKAKAERGGKTGRASSLAGKTLKAVPNSEDGKTAINGRRPGSFGFRSLQIVIDAGAKGIKFEDYIQKGGRNKDAKWDIDHDAATAS